MIKIMFVCLGNICRSPMAEFVLKDMVDKRHLSDQFEIASSATGRLTLGSSVHHGTVKKLNDVGISCRGKRSVLFKKEDYDYYDLIVCMDRSNVKNVIKIAGGDPSEKIIRLLDLTDFPRDIADPWYTGDFEETYRDVLEGCETLLNKKRWIR